MNPLVDQLRQFKNRQVVINYYEDDMLVDRVGFYFNSILINDYQLIFLRNGYPYISIDVSLYREFILMEDFGRYYAFRHSGYRIELYFP